MKKSILALTFLLFTGIAFSQTTVTLQDQCNCEVLKGTDVSTSGAVTPTGADLGDIYVNTNTGTIYFWDGDSWELTATDDQQLTGFNFDGVTNTLSLTLENGGTVNVDLSSLSDVFTDTNTTIASFGIDGTNTNLVITDSEANTFAVALVDLAALINTDNQTLTEVLSQGNDAGGATITNLAVPVNPQDAATKAYVDSVADDDITGVSFDGGTNEVTVSEGGTSFSADLSSLDDSAGVAANAADIANNTTAIGNNTTNISNNASAIATNASDIANNTTAIGNNATDISNNATNISNNTTAIGNNATNITANASDIANNTTAIGNNASNITTNASDIANNTTNILNNASAIATNTSDISNNTTAIGNNATNITTNASDIANNTTNISNNASAIATNTTDIATNATNLANHISADGDLSDTNEIQNIEEVLTDGNDANGLVLTGLGAPTAASDAATKAYVDSVADDDITGVSFDGGTNEVTVSEGGTSFSADLSSLDDSAGVAANAADIANNTTAIGNNASDISNNATNISNNTTAIGNNATDISNNATNITTNATNISNNTTAIGNNASNITTNASDIANNTTNISNNASAIATNTSDIANNATNLANHISADGDLSDTNEIQNIEEVLTDGNDANGLVLTGLGAPTAASDAATKAYVDSVADDDITGVNFDGGTNEVTVSEGGTSFSADLSSLDDSAGVAANAADIANNTTAIGNNATDIANHIAADADTNIGNEYNTGSSITDGVIGITDGGGTESIDLISSDLNNNITFGSDGALYLNVASVSIAETNTSLSYNDATGELTYSNELGNNPVVDISGLDDSAGVAANAADIANNTTAIGNNASDISNNTTNISNNASNITTNATNISNNTTAIGNNASDISNNTTNISNNASAIATNTTDIATNATNLANHISADGDLSDTNEIQNIEEVLTDGNDANGLVLTGLGAPTAASDAATKAYVDSVADDDITGVSFDGGTNEVTVSEGGTSFSADLSSLDDSAGVAANAADIANNTTAIGNNATDISNNTTNISNNASAIATNTSDIANNTTAIGNNASDISNNTTNISNNASAIATNASDIANNTTNISNNASAIATNTSDIANNTTNISNNASAIATNTTDIATNATNLANHISADGDLSDTNEIQNIEEVLTDGNDANGLVLTGLGAPTAGSDAATKAYVDSVADDDITGVSFDGGTNEVTVSEGGTSFSADLSSLDDSAGVAANAADIANNTTAIGNNATDISNNATNISNNTTAIGNNASNITTNTTNISNNATNISNNTTAIGNNASDISNNTTAIGNNASNITTNTTNISNNASAIATNTSDIANNTTAIGNNATDIANHIAADADTNIGNEYNTGSSITDGVIGITDGGGTESIDLISSDLNNNITFGSDGALYLNVASVSIAETNTSLSYNDATGELTYSNELGNNPVVDISGLDDSAGVAANAADIANNTTAIGNNTANITTNASDIANNTTNISNNASAIATNTTDIATNATNLANHISADGDLSDTNEIQNIEEVLTDGNDANGLVLTGLGAPTAGSDAATKAYVDSVADDDITGVSFDGGTNEVTVSEGGTSFSADLSSLDDSAGVAANAADIANNTTAIGNNATDISNNATNISNNTTAIGNNASDISNNTTNISNNASAIATNASDIANNTTNISNNASAIATNTSDIANNTTNISNNASAIATNTTDIATNATNLANHISADGDLSDTNEIQNIEEVLTDGNDANGLVLTGLGAPTAGSDAATKAYVDSVADDDITGVSFDGGTNEVTVSEGGTSFSADLSSLDDSAGVAANAADIANNTTAIGNNATDISNNATNISNNTTNISNNASAIATNTSDIANNTTNISNNASAIATNTTDIATNATNLANHISADGDLSDTNEIQNIEEVLTNGNDANGLVLTGLGAPIAASDAATKAYVDSVADDDITGVSFDGGTNEVTVSEGGTSFSADLSSLDDSAGVAANAADIANNTTAIGNNATDISNNATNISNNTTAIGNNAANITTNATNISNNTTAIGNNASNITTNTTNISNNASAIATNTSDIANNATNLANHISADGDLSDTNEIQNIEEVLTDGNDANGLVLTGLGAPTAGSDAATKAYVDSVADDDITGVSFDGGTNEVTVSEGGTSFSADLSSLDDSAGVAANAADIANNTTAIGNNVTDISNNATNISNNTTAIGNNASNITTNATDIAANATNLANHISADGDLSDTNEIQNIEEVLTDGNDANGLVLTGLGAPTAASDAATKAYVDSVADDDITGVSFDGGTNEVTVSEGGTSFSADLSSLDDSAGVAANAADIANNTTAIGNNVADIANNTTNISNNTSAIATNASDIATNATNLANHISADGDLSDTNEINTRFEVNGANLEIEDSNGTLQVPLADINNQDASEVNSDSPVDVDGDGNTESTVEDVIQDIARITSKAARIFYPPSIAIDASTNGTGRTINLYSQYLAQYGSPTVRSAGAPAAIPTYGATELYYYVTYADPTVFANMTIDANGVLTYDIIGQPADYNALINVVFVVK